MSLTINVPDPLAERLQLRAQAENIPVDKLASRILENGMQRPYVPQQWSVANQRRVALIEKRFTSGLTDHELEELQHLQNLADRQLEELDAKMLNDVARMEANARKILGAAE
jgi:plasmid stability protein